ncbi:TPA: hypothetical protein ACUU9L_000268 [Yersinia enterocolitica]
MEVCPVLLTPSTYFSLLTVVITITGWIITSRLSRSNTIVLSKNNEINKLVDELYKNLDNIHEEMLQLMIKKNDSVFAYHKFIALIRNVTFICNRISVLDNTQKVNQGLLGELRQSCTDDRKYEDARIRTTLAEIQDVQERIKTSFIKKF